jgi:hypothetical protein
MNASPAARVAAVSARVELLANGDLLVHAEGGEASSSRVTKGTPEHAHWMRAVGEGRADLFRAAGRFGGPTRAPEPTVPEILERRRLATTPDSAQRDAIARAAYGGRLPLAELASLRRAGFLPHDADAVDPDGD